MTVWLQDDFTGADGFINGRAPTIALVGNVPKVWVSETILYNSGCLLSSNTVIADGYYAPATLTDLGEFSYQFGYIPCDGISISFTLKIGETTPLSGNTDFIPLMISVDYQGVIFVPTLSYNHLNHHWEIHVDTNNGGNSGAVDVTSAISSGATIAGTCTIHAGVQTITFGGITATGNAQYVNTGLGLGPVRIILGGFCALDSFQFDELAVPPIPTEHADVSSSMPALIVAIEGRDTSFDHYMMCSLPVPVLTATSADTTKAVILRYAYAVAPALTLNAFSGATSEATIPTVEVLITGTTTLAIKSEATLPGLSVSAAGVVSEVATAGALLPMIDVSVYGGAACSIDVGGLTATSAGTTGAIGNGRVGLPQMEFVAVATAGNHGPVALTLPCIKVDTGANAVVSLPGVVLTAIGTAVVAVTYEAYALNLKHSNDKAHDELTRYTNFSFDRIVRYKDSYYGMNATGLYLLEGTTDDGDPIPWKVATHITDFGSPKIKTVQHAYFGGRLGPDATVTLSVGEKADNSYDYTTPRGQTVQNYRQVLGKGAKARYFSLGVSGEDEFELDSLELAAMELARRI